MAPCIAREPSRLRFDLARTSDHFRVEVLGLNLWLMLVLVLVEPLGGGLLIFGIEETPGFFPEPVPPVVF
jgi:hypothetical protein